MLALSDSFFLVSLNLLLFYLISSLPEGLLGIQLNVCGRGFSWVARCTSGGTTRPTAKASTFDRWVRAVRESAAVVKECFLPFATGTSSVGWGFLFFGVFLAPWACPALHQLIFHLMALVSIDQVSFLHVNQIFHFDMSISAWKSYVYSQRFLDGPLPSMTQVYNGLVVRARVEERGRNRQRWSCV